MSCAVAAARSTRRTMAARCIAVTAGTSRRSASSTIQQVKTGLAVPKYCPTQSIDQLNSQASSYDGRIIGIEAGSGLMTSTKKLVSFYGLDLTLVPGSEAAMLATLMKAVSQDECVVVTL